MEICHTVEHVTWLDNKIRKRTGRGGVGVRAEVGLEMELSLKSTQPSRYTII